MDAFGRLIAESELVIVHAGAGSAIQAIQTGRIPVVVPCRAALGEHIDDHQLAFAQELAQLGKIVVATDAQELRQGIGKVLELQRAKGACASPPPLVAPLRERLEAYAREPGACR